MFSEKKIDKLASAMLGRDIKSLQDIIVFQDSDGTYNLFNQYIINKENNSFVVSLETSFTTKTFSLLKNAVTWCTLDKRDRVFDANRLVYLDQKLASIETAITIHSNLAKKAKNIDDKLIYLAKLSEEKAQKRMILEEIDGFISESKRWQIQRFNRKPAQ